MSFYPDSSTTLKPISRPQYVEIGIDTRDFEQYTPYDRTPNEEDSVDHELGLLEVGYNVSPIRSPRSPFHMVSLEDGLLEPARLHIPAHSRKISKGSIVRISPTSEAVLTDESDMRFLEEQRRFQIAKARRQGGSGSSFDRLEMEVLRHEEANMI